MHLKYLSCVTVITQLTVAASAADMRGLVAAASGSVRSVATEQGIMVPYTCTIPGTAVEFEMLPIPGGEFLLGSPADEADRSADEGPQVRVLVPPFWMGKCEVTWSEYRQFMGAYGAFKKLDELRFGKDRMASAKKFIDSMPDVKRYLEQETLEVDAVTCPTPLYDSSFTYAVGEEPDQPAVTMTQFAAKQYTKWLSGVTGDQYRLPTEAEWEYAARAGTTTAYSFGDSPDRLVDYAWYDMNADYETHPVGTKQPNAWGLYDMHGNVAEWVLDAYVPDHYGTLESGMQSVDVTAWPTKLFPRVIRGGSWLTSAAECRCAARQQSDDPEWTLSDPNLPTSPWWFTEEQSTGVGFRLVRPLAGMDAGQQKNVWDADIKQIQQDVTDRLAEGRGAQTSADSRLPDAIEALKRAGEID